MKNLLTNKLKSNSISSYFRKILSFWAKNELKLMLLLLAVAIVLPIVVNQRYFTSILINCALYTVLVLSLNLITGFMGITSLGHAAFYGIGAYTAAILSTRFGFNFILTFIAAAVVAGLFGLFLGIPTLRVKGKYLAIVTLGFCEITRIVELNWMSLTNGPMGISRIPSFNLIGKKTSAPLTRYYVALVLVVITIYIVYAIINSRAGRAVTAIRDDEIAASAMGINVFKYKLLIFAISSALAGLAGAFYAHHMSFIDPKSFSFDQSILMLSMVILGGMGSIPGSIFGAVTLSVVPEILRDWAEYRQIIYGLVIVVMVIAKPNGLCGDFNLKHIRLKDVFNKQRGEKEGSKNV